MQLTTPGDMGRARTASVPPRQVINGAWRYWRWGVLAGLLRLCRSAHIAAHWDAIVDAAGHSRRSHEDGSGRSAPARFKRGAEAEYATSLLGCFSKMVRHRHVHLRRIKENKQARDVHSGANYGRLYEIRLKRQSASGEAWRISWSTLPLPGLSAWR